MADRVAIASDHAAFEMTDALGAWLTENGFEVADLGPATADYVDSPDYGYRWAPSIASREARWGVALCEWDLDRESLVYGKSGAGRVALGGCGICKKKKC